MISKKGIRGDIEVSEDKIKENNVEEKKSVSKKNLKWVILTVLVVVAAVEVVIGIVTYTQSPSYKAKQQLSIAEKYLDDLDYEQAIACFQLALEIDPDNEEVIAMLKEHMDEFYQQARQYGSQEEFASEKEIAAFMFFVDRNSWQAMVADAEADFGTGEVKKAKDTYEKAKSEGAVESEIGSEIKLCDVILKLLELCKAGDWKGVIDFSNSTDFDSIKELLRKKQILSFEDDLTTVIEQNADGSYVVSKNMQDGSGAMVISAANTNFIYEGDFKENQPNGKGKLTIWNKNETIANANIYQGTFFEGKLNGLISFTTVMNSEEKNFSLEINEGVVSVYQTDENGNVWITDEQSDNGCAYVVEYVTGTGNIIADYIAGVPGYGGSDRKLSVILLDVTPPEIICTLPLFASYIHNGRNPGGRGIVATDNLDGDLTEKIFFKTSKTKNSYGYQESWRYGLIVVYAVADAAGNTSELTVTYDVEPACGDWRYWVTSIK